LPEQAATAYFQRQANYNKSRPRFAGSGREASVAGHPSIWYERCINCIFFDLKQVTDIFFPERWLALLECIKYPIIPAGRKAIK
jgi:hypothetical protein